MKRAGIISLIIVIVLLIIYIVNPFGNELPLLGGSKTSDIVDVVSLTDKSVSVTYYGGNLIDEKLDYNNSLEKIIKIENTNSDNLSYSIRLSESSISNEKLVYSLLVSNEINGEYQSIINEKSISGDYCMKYNLGIEANKTQFIKVIFKSYNELDTTSLKGKISVSSDLTKKDVFANNVSDTYHAIIDKIDSLNGIRWSGYYNIDVRDLGLPDSDLSGFVVLNATDISDITYYFNVYNSSYMLYKYQYNSSFSKKYVKDIDYGVLGEINYDTTCAFYTKKGCSRLMDLGYNEGGSKKDFKEAADQVIELVKKDFDKSKKNVVIYDVTTDITNNTNIRGFILINNQSGEPEYYLYLTNNIFMIAGYNLTKLGDFSLSSTTIRAYLDSSWKVSVDNKNHVCSFSGFSNCQDKSGNVV